MPSPSSRSECSGGDHTRRTLTRYFLFFDPIPFVIYTHTFNGPASLGDTLPGIPRNSFGLRIRDGTHGHNAPLCFPSLCL